MAQYEEQNPLDYRSGGDTVDDFAQKYMKEIARIYQFLNNLREHNSTGPNQVEPQPYQFKAENGKMYIRNAANSAWLYLFDIAYRMGMSDNPDAVILTNDDISSTGEALKLVKTDENGVANISISGSAAELDGHGVSYFVTTAEVADVPTGTVTSEANKLVKTNANGVLPVNILGNCGKMAGYNIEVNNLTDGQVFTYRSASNSWRNEDKGVVGAGKALAMYDGPTLLFEYSGDAPQSFDTEKTSIKGDITTLQGDVTTLQGDVTDVQGDLGSFLRQPSTAYAAGDIVFLPAIGAELFLECTTAGTTGSGDLVISTPLPNDTVADGTVTWTLRKLGTDPNTLTREVTPAFNSRDVITTSGTYTAPVTGWYKITAKGGGGGGSGVYSDSNTSIGGQGGGEGGTTIVYVSMTAGETAAVVIGAGGSGGAYGGAKASDGGNTTVTIDGTTYIGGGGTGGQTTGTSHPSGGTGTINGCAGGSGEKCMANSQAAQGGAGGGAGGGASAYAGNGDSGTQGGGGAGGSGSGGQQSVGGAGGDGYVWFEYFATI